jgi:hypothetical protein
MEARAKFLIAYAAEHGPVTVRGLYYQAEVAAPGIDKTDSSYVKVQRQVLSLRREGRLSYGDISDMPPLARLRSAVARGPFAH